MSSAQKQKAKAEAVEEAEHEEQVIDDTRDVDSPSTSSQKKKKRSKEKTAPKIPQEIIDVVDNVKADGAPSSSDVTPENVRQILEQLKFLDIIKGKAGLSGISKKDIGEHKFWATQPVPQPGDMTLQEDGYIDPPRQTEQIRQDPYPLPKEFEWATVDIGDPKQTKEVYDLLSLNYVEDDEAAFRFQYSAEFLSWALKPPGYQKEWHIGVRVSANKKLVAFISGVPLTMRVRGNHFRATEINYLCVHKKLRSKRLAPVLIKEVTRRVHLTGIFQAIYTAGIVIPTPVSVCRYYHRLINVPKLLEVKFCHVPRNMTIARMIRVNKVADTTSIQGLREMEDKDVEDVAKMFTRYQTRFDLAPVYDVDEIKHLFLSGRGTGSLGDGGPGRRIGQVTWAYVVENADTHQVTDFFSFYSLPSTVIANTKYPTLEAGYLFYYGTDIAFAEAADTDDRVKERITTLLGDAIVVARAAEFDVFNCLTLMDNVTCLQDLKFGVGDGFLNYYLYNWRTRPLAGMNTEGDVAPGRGVGLVML